MAYPRRLNMVVAAVTAGVTAALFVALDIAAPAQGATGDALVLGRTNWSTTTTYLNWHPRLAPTPDAGLAVLGTRTGAVFATDEQYVHGDPTSLDGVRAFGADRGGFFYGVDTGVEASSEQVGIAASGQEEGVRASGDTGVRAIGDNVGLDAQGTTAIRAQGAVSFSSAGLVTILAGTSSAAATPGPQVTASSMVLATAQTPGGQVLRISRNPAANTIRIFLVAPATQDVQVAYFVIG